MTPHQPDPAAQVVAPDPALEAAARRAGLSPATARALARGAAIYHHGLFWEAHEAWEEAWLEEEGAPRLLLHGLIQLAAAFHKAVAQRQSGGCVRLFTTALEKLEKLQAAAGGIDLPAVREGCARALALAVAWHAGRGPPPGRGDAPVIGAAPSK